jgi:hypothetical protein
MKTYKKAIEYLVGRGKTVLEGAAVDFEYEGYRPDAVAYDEFNRLVAIVINQTTKPNKDSLRINALRDWATSQNVRVYLIKQTNRVNKYPRRK